MAWLPATGLLREQGLPTNPQEAVERLCWLGRYGLAEHLQAEAARLRSSSLWSPPLALGLSVAWLLAADGRAADHAFLEADRLAPGYGLLPDPWGLWSPTEAKELPADWLELVAAFRRWRWLDAEALRAQWADRVASNWRWALTSEGLDGLALLVRHHQALAEPLQPFLAQLVGEAEMDADPGQAARFWGFLCDLWPDWSYARLKASELALGLGDHHQALLWLEQAPEADRASAWHWDLLARQALAADRVPEALDAWGEAVRRALAAGDAQSEALAELFRQRRRDARRGPALLIARAWLDSGRVDEARALLAQLLEQDPQWQPLRALHDQALLATAHGSAGSMEAGTSGSAGSPQAIRTPQVVSTQVAELDSASAGAAHLDRFAGLLDRVAGQRGIPLPQPQSDVDPSPEVNRQHLERFASALSTAEARLALAA